MLLPAPGRFSTSTGWPRLSLILDAATRARISPVVPGGKPTTMRTGLAGQPAWPCVALAAASDSTPISASPTIFMGSPGGKHVGQQAAAVERGLSLREARR